jgi:hypothetical protein
MEIKPQYCKEEIIIENYNQKHLRLKKEIQKN